jgi:hypothetical protein
MAKKKQPGRQYRGAAPIPDAVIDATPDPNVMPDITGPGGHESTYDSKYDQMLIDHMSKGLSFESFGGVIEVSARTLYNWSKANASFLHAKTIGTSKCRLWWETVGVAYVVEGRRGRVKGPDGQVIDQKATEKLNSNIYRLNMINRFGWKNSGSEESDGAGVTLNLHATIMDAINKKRNGVKG